MAVGEKPARAGGVGGKRRCKYGADCRFRHSCKFYHPPLPEASDGAKTSHHVGHEKKAASQTQDRSKIRCKYGMKCTNAKCPFFHHPAAAPLSPPASPARASNAKIPPDHPSPPTINTNTVASPSRKAAKKKKCRWGAGCRNKRCAFIHPPGIQTDGNAVGRNGERGEEELGEGTGEYVREKTAAVPEFIAEETAPANPGIDILAAIQEPLAGLQLASSNDQARAPPDPQPSSLVFDGAVPEGVGGMPQFDAMMFNASVMPPGLTEELPAVHPVDELPDAEWLYEVLGLNELDERETVGGQPRQPVVESVDQNPYFDANDAGITLGNETTNDVARQQLLAALGIEDETDLSVGGVRESAGERSEESCPSSEEVVVNGNNTEAATNDAVPISVDRNEVEESPKTMLLPENEMDESRKVALELRFEAQQSNCDPATRNTLLQTCRSKQIMIQTALEQSMDGAEVDEGNIASLLELNELLVGAIEVAESSRHTARQNAARKVRLNTDAEEFEPSPEMFEQARESWKSVDRKTAPTATKTVPTVAKTVAKKTKVKAQKKKTLNDAAKQQKQDEKQEEEPTADAVQQTSQVKTPEEDPRERKQRLLEEARKQSAAAREKKKSKKSKKFDRWLKQEEEARERRSKFWAERVARETDYIDLIQKLFIAEFLRQNQSKAMGLTAERVLSDADASETLSVECREAYQAVFEGHKCRVSVAGSDNKDMNGRHGTLRHWDKEKGKFCVGLDTKKSPDSDVQFLSPEILDVLPLARSAKADKKTETCYDIDVSELINYGGVVLGFSFTLLKSHVVLLGSAESTKAGLDAFCKSREEEERRQKMEEEAEKNREEEDRKRRAARRAQENAEFERRKAQARRDREQYEEMKREFANDKSGNFASMFGFDDDEDDEDDDDEDDDEDDEECDCPRCRFRDNFFSSGGTFFFNIGGIPFSFGFDDDPFFGGGGRFDEQWEEKLAEEREEENREMAEVLGVEPDADERTLKVAYRKLALQYHPDKWKSDSEHGMTKSDAEDQFKSIQTAYDHLMSNFDDED